jgi:hypothetical protein
MLERSIIILLVLATSARADGPRETDPEELSAGVASYLLPVPAAMRAAASLRETGERLVVPMAVIAYDHSLTSRQGIDVRIDSLGLVTRLEAGWRLRAWDRAIAPYGALRMGASAMLPPLADGSVELGFSTSANAGVELLPTKHVEIDVEAEVGIFANTPVAGLTILVGPRGRR